ncbi:glycosyltransferase family 2 protein [Chromobacterium haemolyticum]|uniref:Glycosyltransferase 2-like domain-containing protein n=1 Tax=Chromobacterium haemolyticum TaxID=394935 RepID=A0A1W0CV47_9NEIS|nr:glycosyltransferase family 2 protein [Chromobacterium haemolyticum]OQS38639.1 hypothetical protein B0T45_12730 [Chromobacterium haemolyticum]
MDCLISIVIATYNRGYCIASTVDSVVLAFLDLAVNVEVVIVDDHSSDNTEKLVKEKYREYINRGLVSYYKLPVNKGVSGARNVGVGYARGEWVVFLDSDDTLLGESGPNIVKELKIYSQAPVVFFRCIDQDNNKVGFDFRRDSQSIGLQSFLQYGSRGECLVAVKRHLMLEIPFVEYLRGYEGLTIAKIMRRSGREAILSSVVARRYIQTADDRLSSKAGFASRMNLIGQGHWLMAKEFFNDASLKVVMLYVLKSLAYRVLYLKNKILN